MLGLLCDSADGMTGRWELNDEQWALLEVLRPARRADNRGRVRGMTRVRC